MDAKRLTDWIKERQDDPSLTEGTKQLLRDLESDLLEMMVQDRLFSPVVMFKTPDLLNLFSDLYEFLLVILTNTVLTEGIDMDVATTVVDYRFKMFCIRAVAERAITNG